MDPDTDLVPDPALFVSDIHKKYYFFPTYFCLLIFEDTFTPLFKDKKSKRSHKTVKILDCLTISA
jgi:hypothetical protein